MATKTYNAESAINPNQENPDEEQEMSQDDINYQEFVDTLPEEFRDEIEQALAALISYIHSDEGTTTIIDDLQKAKGNEAQQVGISALQAMDSADVDHEWSDSSKVFCGYFAVSEVALIGREAGIVDIPDEQREEIFKEASKNYLHSLIKNKPTPEEREAEAIRLQKEVEPLLSEKMREAGHSVAKEQGIATGAEEKQAAGQGGLLE